MARRTFENKLISKESIKEEMRLISGSNTDYVTSSGNVYKHFGDNKFYKKSVFKNSHNGYMYTTITYENEQRQRRVHILVAEAFIENDNKYPYVMHLDNNKSNNDVSNLMWGNASMNTKQAFEDGLVKNASGFDDSQSLPVCYFDLDKNYLGEFGSMSIASKCLGITKTQISNQCRFRGPIRKPRKGYYFRFLDEYKKFGFIL